MEELIKIEVKNDQQLVSARDLYKLLGLKIRFSLWVSKNFEQFEEGTDFTSVSVDTEVPNHGGYQTRKLQDYFLTLDAAKELCMMSKTEKGKEVRKYFIQVEKNWNNPDMIMKRAMAIANARIEKLEAKTLALSTQLEGANKKVSYLDVILGTKDALAVTQIAADYGYSARAFNSLLKDAGIQHKVNGQWVLYKAFMGKGYVVTKTFLYGEAKQHGKQLTYWTQKGRKLIYDVLKDKEGVLPLIERDDIA